MSLKKPFSQVWWCEFNALPEALRAGTRSVLGIADNVDGLDWQSMDPGRFIHRIILPHDENKPISDDYLDVLLGCASMFAAAGWLPLTVFCWAGQHRSPAVCATIQAHFSDEGIEGCIERVSELWPHFQTHHRYGIYASSLIEKYKALALRTEQPTYGTSLMREAINRFKEKRDATAADSLPKV